MRGPDVAALGSGDATQRLAARDTGSGADEAVIADIRAATRAWVEAFDARDAARIAGLYAPDAVFWGTTESEVGTTPAEVRAYFEASVRDRPALRMTLGASHVRAFGEGAVHSGHYTAIDPGAGEAGRTPLRFTFVYRREGTRWVIVAHHSSRMPAP